MRRVLWLVSAIAIAEAGTTCSVVYTTRAATPAPTSTTTPSSPTKDPSSSSNDEPTMAPATLFPDASTPAPTSLQPNETTLPPNVNATTPTPTTVPTPDATPVATTATVAPTTLPTTPTTTPKPTGKTKTPAPTVDRRLRQVVDSNSTNTTTSVPPPTPVVPTPVPNDGSWSGSRSGSNDVITLSPLATPSPFDIACDATLYGQWAARNLTCAGAPLNVSAAVDAAACAVYKGSAPSLRDVCVSLCTLPSCDAGAWNYHADAGAISSIYASIDVASFFPSAIASTIQNVSVASVCPAAGNTTSTLASCGCPAPWSSSPTTAPASPTPAPAVVNPLWNWVPTNAEAAVAPLAKTTAAATIAIGTVVSISGGLVSSASAATTVAASSSMMLFTFDMLQFGSMLNQIPLSEKSNVLTEFGAQMKFAVFNYLGFLFPDTTATTSSTHATRFLNMASPGDCQGVCQYALTIGVSETRLFLLTLLGVLVAGAAVLLLYGLAVGFVHYGLQKPDMTNTWFDYAIGGLVILGMASQYAIGVTGVYQLYLGVRDRVFDVSFFLAILSLLFLALGLLWFGYYIIQKHERDLLDVAKVEHTKKAVNMRYGALYDEYTFENRFFFAPKMLLALLCGMTTGAAFLNATLQIVLILVFHICFLVHLEQCQPFQTRFLQHSMALITLVKIVTLILSMFLISSIEGLPQGFHDVVSNIIVALQLLVLAALMVRQVVLLYQRWRAEKMHDEQQAAMESALKPLDSLETLAVLRRPSMDTKSTLQPVKSDGIMRL